MRAVIRFSRAPGPGTRARLSDETADRRPLKIKGTASDEIVFLVETGGTTYRVTNNPGNGDKQLLFVIPAGLPPSTGLTLQVRARRKGSVTLRTASWPVTLNIA